MAWTSYPVSSISGVIRAPGDKSCSHRALMMAGIAEGVSIVSGLLEGADVLDTAKAMESLGAGMERQGPGRWKVTGTGARGLTSPTDVIDFGNSGTGSRLMMGLMSGYDISVEMTGDKSLRGRPMDRVMNPLEEMGARFDHDGSRRLPLTLHGSASLKAIDFTPPHASAQVKSCVLLAGLNAEGTTRVYEPRATRDHTEKMLRGFGVKLDVADRSDGVRLVAITGGQTLQALDTGIPGDPSSAAFLAAAAIISGHGDVMIENVMSNDTRDGFFQAISSMGVSVGAEDNGEAAGERLMDIQVSSSALTGKDIPEWIVPSMIDEFPILAVCAAFATGVTRVTGASELRVKESDRIKAIMGLLRVNGVEAEETEDGFIVHGCGGPPPGGGLVETHHDHRIAMSALIMGTASQQPVSVDDISMIATSYPDFMDHMRTLGADIREG